MTCTADDELILLTVNHINMSMHAFKDCRVGYTPVQPDECPAYSLGETHLLF